MIGSINILKYILKSIWIPPVPQFGVSQHLFSLNSLAITIGQRSGNSDEAARRAGLCFANFDIAN